MTSTQNPTTATETLSVDELLTICQDAADKLHGRLDTLAEIAALVDAGRQAAAALTARGYPSVAWAEVEYEMEMNR